MPFPEDPPRKSRSPLLVICGPTGVGKTKLALQLGKRLEAEIVSADSRLLYRGMDIGTAKPTPSERQQVPHHLIDVADPDENWSLSLFQLEAYRVIDDILERGHLPILVGGTGQYLRAITEGWVIPRQEPDRRLRDVLEKWGEELGAEKIHSLLAVVDPQAAGKIDPRNIRRTVRALEVIFRSGERFSSQRRKGNLRYRTLTVGLTCPRPELYQRIDSRIEAMVQAGFVDEVRGLLEQGYSPDLPSFSAIGYREIATFLAGDISLDEAVVQIKRKTRQYVRRQANWFKPSDPEINWFLVQPGVIDEIERLIHQFLRESH